MTDKKQFIKHIAYLQIIGIMLVVFGHSFHEYPDGNHGNSMLIYRLLYSFRMPLFLFVSGFLMQYTTSIRNSSPSWKQFTRNKARRLLIPMCILSIITFIPRSFLSSMADDTITLSFTSLARGLVYSNEMVIPFFWFLQASFLLLSFCYGLISLGKVLNLKDGYVLSFLFGLFLCLYCIPFRLSDFFALNQVQRLGIFFVAGIIYCRYHQEINARINFTSPAVGLSFCLVWLSLFFMVENTQLIVFCSFLGILMLISLARILEKKGSYMLDILIGSNYIIFLLSWYCNVFSQQVLHYYLDFPWWVFTILSFTSGILIPWAFYQVMIRTKKHSTTKLIAFCLGQSLSRPSLRTPKPIQESYIVPSED